MTQIKSLNPVRFRVECLGFLSFDYQDPSELSSPLTPLQWLAFDVEPHLSADGRFSALDRMAATVSSSTFGFRAAGWWSHQEEEADEENTEGEETEEPT